MNHKKILIQLYYLLVGSKETAGVREEAMGRRMIDHEGIDAAGFNNLINELNLEDRLVLYRNCIQELKKLSQVTQVRFIAWMVLIANADGFMEETEWQLIYKIYHKELNLSLSEIMSEQKVLNDKIKNSVLPIK